MVMRRGGKSGSLANIRRRVACSPDHDICFPPSTGNDEQHQALNDMGAFGGPGACGRVTP
jgi:hypothetical protein